MKTITEIKGELSNLTEIWRLVSDPRVAAAIELVRKENSPKAEALRSQLKELRSAKKPVRRWPDNTPEEILNTCKDYWSGTTEGYSFRIHQWSDKAIWTSYPSGGYSTVGGWHDTPPAYHLISRIEREGGNRVGGRPKLLKEIRFEFNSGKRVTKKMMKSELEIL